ncbi:MAG TPA: glucose 1-dehydrogenase [Thermomicrobiales bacterium]|nr:glucose 1-dehydrogenase [Thermomicrobiales bacterium]
MRLDHAVALVTGGGSGIGRAICQRFAREGASIVAVDWHGDAAAETVRLVEEAGGAGLAITADVTDRPAVERAVREAEERFGRIDILVCNAGVSKGNDLVTIDEATWDGTVDIVLKGTYLFAKAALPGMIARKKGVVLTVASVNGQTGLGEEPYSAAKAGVINLTQNIAVRHGRDGIRANCIAPGTVRTPIWSERVAANPAVFDQLAAWYPLGRVGEAEDIANAALFLASDEASWISGVTLNVDGGLMAGRYRMGEDLSGSR